MVSYQHFIALCNSPDADQRGEAAHMVATAYVDHDGPEDERAALYASVLGFLDDPSVKVRASLAYGLLHSELAPRIVMLSLVKDAPIIARAVVQYSPVLLDVDLIGAIRDGDARVLLALASRSTLSEKLLRALVARGDIKSILGILARDDLEICPDILETLARDYGSDSKIRGRLLSRSDLPAFSRLELVEQVKLALGGCRMVKGSLAPDRLTRVMRDALDSAATRIGEDQAVVGQDIYVQKMHADDRINTRLLLHSVVNGHVLFFAQCIAQIGAMPSKKVFTLLENGARGALNALFVQCGMSPALCNLLARLVLHARVSDLSNDDAARHFVVTALIEELIIEHERDIPETLEEAFRYLDEQNMELARSAARGVMPAFAEQTEPDQLLLQEDLRHVADGMPLEGHCVQAAQLALPAA